MSDKSEAWDAPQVALRESKKAAKRAHQQCRGLISYEDLLSIGYLWIAKHKDKTLEWCDKDLHPLGWKALSKSMLRAMNKEVAKERVRRTGADSTDAFYYTPGIIEEVLPDIWEYEDRVLTASHREPDAPRGKMLPGEGGNREAILADISKAVSRLAVEEQSILQAKYVSGLTNVGIGKVHGISDDTVERRLHNITRSIIDYLGGESPWRTRRPRSNAAAQAETRNQWEGDEW